MDLQEGDVRSYERTITEEDITQFAEISGDRDSNISNVTPKDD
jgi:acyl dehydratase